MANWPGSVKNFLLLEDGVDKVIAQHPNERGSEITALQTYIGTSGEVQSKNVALMNLFKDMFNPSPKISWIDDDTIEIETKTIAIFNGNDYVIKRNASATQIKLSVNLDTGDEAADTWYYVWLCGDTLDSTYTAVFSLSDSAPTGYTYYILIGLVYNDSDSNIDINHVNNWDGIHYIKVSDVKASGTHGGTFTLGDWRTRVINTEDSDTGSHCSIAANQITLAAGTYECLIMCPASNVRYHKARLYNITDGATTLLGTSEYCLDDTQGISRIIGRFTIAAEKVFEIQHYCKQTQADNGFGNHTSIAGVSEVYTVAEFRKVK